MPMPTYVNERAVDLSQPKERKLGPPPVLAVGTILTIRMQGHSRTNGQEYFAPAIVLDQFDDQQGSIEALVFDATAGTHYQHSYPIRDLSTRGDGNEREVYELRSNIGNILFRPDEFLRVSHLLSDLVDRVARLEHQLPKVETNKK